MITGRVYLDAVATSGVVVVAVSLIATGDPAAYEVLDDATTDGSGDYSLDIAPYAADVAIVVIPPALSGAQPLVFAPIPGTYSGLDFYLTDTAYVPPAGDDIALTLAGALLSSSGPTPQSVNENTTATFTVTASGGALPYSYQWYEDGVLLPGETDATLDFTATNAESGKVYSCQITDDDGFTVTSAGAVLTVVDFQPVITTQPVDTTAFFNQPISLSVAATSSGGALTYQWYDASDDSPVPGATSATFAVSANATVDMTGDSYYVTVTDDNGTEQSDTATLTVTYNVRDVRNLRLVPWSIANAAPDRSFLTSRMFVWSVADAATARKIAEFRCPVRAHRGIEPSGKTYWIPFYDRSARAHRGPLVNDLYNRYYWTQDGQEPRYAPLQMLQLDGYTEGLALGVPAPESKANIRTRSPAEDDIAVSRAYVYTYVTLYGEEGPPSPPALASGVEGETWEYRGMATGPDDTFRRRITHKNIYRTVSVNGTAQYHFVRRVPIEVTTFYDDDPTSAIGQNFTLESTSFSPPPPDMKGLTAHPNGFFVGFVDRTIMFSEPYRPHAWPQEYQLSTIGKIVALGVFGTSVVVATDSHPYIITGINPQAMVMTMHDTSEPCMSRFGLVSMPFGVFYPGPNGLVLVSPRGVETATKDLMTREEWQTRYQITKLDACKYENRYVAFYNKTRGFMFSPNENAALVDLDLEEANYEPDKQDSIFTDVYTGKVFIMSDCQMYEWNPISGEPLGYDWESLEFDIPDPTNFGAGRLIWYAKYTPPTEEQTNEWRGWNTARMAAAPLNPMNYHALNAPRQEVVVGFDDFPQVKQPFHASPLIVVPDEGAEWPNTPYVILDVIANDRVVYSRNITHTKMFRLPAGYKATMYRFRLRSNIHIQSLKVAETGRELSRV